MRSESNSPAPRNDVRRLGPVPDPGHERPIGSTSVPGLLSAVCRAAVERVPGSAAASLSVLRGRDRYETLTATDETAAQVDAAQFAARTGPLVAAVRGGPLCVGSADLGTDGRWPQLAEAIEEVGPHSVLVARLCTDEDGTLGVLSLYARSRAAFDRASQVALEACAPWAALALSAVRNQEQVVHLQRALQTNRDIGTAIGIIMAHRVVTRDAAYALLRSASQSLHRKLADVAEDVIRTGILEFPPGRDLRATFTAPSSAAGA